MMLCHACSLCCLGSVSAFEAAEGSLCDASSSRQNRHHCCQNKLCLLHGVAQHPLKLSRAQTQTHLVHDAGFFKGVGKGVVGAIAQPISGGLDFASSAFEGIDATKDQLIGRPRAGTANRRLRLPRAIGGDGKVTAFIGSDGSEKEVTSTALPVYCSKLIVHLQMYNGDMHV